MSSIIDCPACRGPLRLPDEFLGQSVRCPTCGETFTAPSAEAEPSPSPAEPEPLLTVPLDLELGEASPPPPQSAEPSAPQRPRRAEEPPRRRRKPEPDDEDEDDEDYRRRRRRRRDYEPCPRCDEDVRRGAVACPFCGLDLEEQGDGYTRRRRVRYDAEPHRGGVVQGLGIASLVLGVFYFLFIISLPLGIAAWVMGRRDLKKMEAGLMDPSGRKKTRDGWICGIVGTVLSLVCTCICLAMVLLAVMVEESRPSTRGRAGAVGQVQNPLVGQNPPPPVNNFSLRGPGGGPLVIRRGEKQTITLTVQRVAAFQGGVLIAAAGGEWRTNFIVTPVEQKVLGAQQAATFTIQVKPNALPGLRVVQFLATSDAGDAVEFDVSVNVVK